MSIPTIVLGLCRGWFRARTTDCTDRDIKNIIDARKAQIDKTGKEALEKFRSNLPPIVTFEPLEGRAEVKREAPRDKK